MPEIASLLREPLETYIAQQPEFKVVVPKKEPAVRVKPIDRSQAFWGAIDIEKLIEADHPARGIWAMLNQLDLRRLYSKIKAVEGRAGQNSWDPKLLMALWIYGYSEGISSARELSRMCGYEPGCQWLSATEVINHHALSDFRVRYKEDLEEIFVQVLGLLSAEGLVELKRIGQQQHPIGGRATLQVGEAHRAELLDERTRPIFEHVGDRHIVSDTEGHV